MYRAIDVWKKIDGGLIRYRCFEILESGVVAQSEWPRLQTSWAWRLSGNESRTIIYIIARAKADDAEM